MVRCLEETMPQWEYCRVTWMARQITDVQQRDLQAHGFAGEIHKEADPISPYGSAIIARLGRLTVFGQSSETAELFTDLDSVVARLGRDGWELVSHTSIGDNTEFFFKRPLQEQAAER
jgi:hypothetical protein